MRPDRRGQVLALLDEALKTPPEGRPAVTRSSIVR